MAPCAIRGANTTKKVQVVIAGSFGRALSPMDSMLIRDRHRRVHWRWPVVAAGLVILARILCAQAGTTCTTLSGRILNFRGGPVNDARVSLSLHDKDGRMVWQ